MTDQIRLHRLYDNTSENVDSLTYTGFTFPKIGTVTCVAKVDVWWHQFKFNYCVEFIDNSEDVENLIVTAVNKAIDTKPENKPQPQLKSMGLINFSPAELTEFVDGVMHCFILKEHDTMHYHAGNGNEMFRQPQKLYCTQIVTLKRCYWELVEMRTGFQ